MKNHLAKKVFVFSVILSFLFCTVALADSGERAPTQSEKDFYQKVLNTLIKVIPPQPAGWDQDVFFHSLKLERVTAGLEKEPFRVEYFTGWRDTKTINASQEKLAAAYMELSKNPANITDKAIEELQKKVEPHDVTLRIDLEVNFDSIYIGDPPKPAPAVADGLVYRTDSKWDSGGGWREGTTFVFLGKGWRLDTSAGIYMNFKPNPATPSLVAQCITVKIKADPDRAKKIIEKIDWSSLKALLNK